MKNLKQRTIQINPNAVGLLGFASVEVPPSRIEFPGQKNLMESFRTISQTQPGLVSHGLGYVLKDIGVRDNKIKEISEALFSLIENLSGQRASLEQLEFECKRFIADAIPNTTENIDMALSNRARIIFNQVSGFVQGSSVLDLGAGDGKVGALLQVESGFDVYLADVMELADNTCMGLPFFLYDGMTLPFSDQSYDTTLLLTVLHHADEPLRVLEEAIRVTRKRIIIIESVYFTEEHRTFNMFLDWFYNRILHDSVNCPFNFQSPLGWELTFKRHKLKISGSLNLGLDQRVVPEYHWLYLLDVIR